MNSDQNRLIESVFEDYAKQYDVDGETIKMIFKKQLINHASTYMKNVAYDRIDNVVLFEQGVVMIAYLYNKRYCYLHKKLSKKMLHKVMKRFEKTLENEVLKQKKAWIFKQAARLAPLYVKLDAGGQAVLYDRKRRPFSKEFKVLVQGGVEHRSKKVYVKNTFVKNGRICIKTVQNDPRRKQKLMWQTSKERS